MDVVMEGTDIEEPVDLDVDIGSTGGIDMPTVRISSMYDLQTNTKMGIIGIHTPSAGQLVTKYDGLLKNYKYLKVKTCSVKIACASTLPADPLQVGVSSGKISPADLMNPILYKAVSNDSWNGVINKIYNTTGPWDGDSANGLDDAFPAATAGNAERVYYSLLAGKEWRKVMPQQGLSVKGLKPLVHEVVSVYGNQFKTVSQYADTPNDQLVAGSAVGGVNGPVLIQDANTMFRGRSLPMPAIPTVSVDISGESPAVSTVPTIPKTFVLAIVVPPMQLQKLYYRMIVTWDLVFFGLRPTTDWDISALVADGAFTRYSRWSISSSKDLESNDDNKADSVGCVDTLNMDPELVMES